MLIPVASQAVNQVKETAYSILFQPPPPKYNFHNDNSLHVQDEKEPLSAIAGLPKDILALGKFAAGFGLEPAKRAAVASLPLDDPLSQFFMAKGVKKLYGKMLHPPLSYRGGQFQYRTADGADNSILHPQLGKAGVPYAKTVPSKAGIHGARPDAGDLFDLLMARKEDRMSNSGISSMLLTHATLIIHDIFRTSRLDSNLSDTSSYLDLSPLYGTDKHAQDAVRKFENGLLKPDTFAEERLLLQPPAISIYIIMYNRFHNYVAEQLLSINENGKFSLNPPEGSEQWLALSIEKQKALKKKQDEDLFQTARLITCGMYINISIHDYLRVLMGFHSYDTPWTLDPRIEIPGFDDKEGIERGIGNQVSLEFNMLYRFHSPISKRNREWTEKLLTKLSNGEISERDAREGTFTIEQLRELRTIGPKLDETPKERRARLAEWKGMPYFPKGLEHTGKETYWFLRDDSTGKFNDAELAAEMVKTMEDPICQFGPQNTPKVLKMVEIMGTLQARKWEVATLNEFREFFGLKRHKYFEDISDDKNVTDALRSLYEDPDMIEFYPGLWCEGKGRNLDPGTEMPNKSVESALWAGVFCDAVTLVRSDRFYTVDWNVRSLTSWGMREVTSNPDVMKGSVMHRLFQRAFPGHFKYNSVHMWQPFVTPPQNLILAAQQKYLKQLDLTDLEFSKTLNLDPKDKHFAWKLSNMKFEQLVDKTRHECLITRTVETNTNTNMKYLPSPQPMIRIDDYHEIHGRVLGSSKNEFQNPGILDLENIPNKYLRQMLGGTHPGFEEAAKNCAGLVNSDLKRNFAEYFTNVSKEIADRQKRYMQVNERGEQIFQLDLVRDYAIPVVTRFVADFLGFWDLMKTPQHPNHPKYSEADIYAHLRNCQDYLAYDSDETSTWKRRLDFKESITVLHRLAHHGAWESRAGRLGGLFDILLARRLQTPGDKPYVVRMREFGVKMARTLGRSLRGGHDEVAAMMLMIALETAHKAVLTFTEVVAYYIDPTNGCSPSRWDAIQKLAFRDTPESFEQLKPYVLEAQRLCVKLPLVRVYTPSLNEKYGYATCSVKVDNGKMRVLKKGDKVLLDLHKAQRDPRIFENPDAFNVNRDVSTYLIYGRYGKSGFSTKQLTLIALTGMFKYLGRLQELRVAHEEGGRIKRATTPEGVESYMTIQWDQLVPFPTTWYLRFNGEGRKAYNGKDNSRQGHGMETVCQAPSSIPAGGTYKSGSSG